MEAVLTIRPVKQKVLEGIHYAGPRLKTQFVNCQPGPVLTLAGTS